MSALRVTQSNASGIGSPMQAEPKVNTEAATKDDDPTNAPFGVVLLAGALKPSKLRQALDVPPLCLPLAADATVLSVWLDLLERTERCSWLKILVSSTADVHAMKEALAACDGQRHSDLTLDVELDKGAWRGPAGLLRDIIVDADVDDQLPVVAAEASCLPPPSLKPLLDELSPEVHGVVGCDVRWHEPAGLYAFRAGTLAEVPSRGYYDIKEQLLPHMYERNLAVKCAATTDVVSRIRCRDSYLRSVQTMLNTALSGRGISESASISTEARVHKDCVVQEGVSIADGAIVHRSVLLRGARIGGGAIIANSIIGCEVSVEARSVVKGEIRAQPNLPDSTLPVTTPGIFSRFRPRRDRDARLAKANRSW